MSKVFKYFFSKLKCLPQQSDPNYRVSQQENPDFQPNISFAKLPMLFKTPLDEEWNGIKFGLGFKPSSFFNLDYSMILSKKKKLKDTILASCMCFLPLNPSGNKGAVLVGRKGPQKSNVFQYQFLLNERNKISVLEQHQDDTLERTVFTTEFSHDFNRSNVSFKYSNVEPISINAITSLYKNLFVGIEAYKYPGEFYFGYNYALYLKNTLNNKLGATLSYFTTLPGFFVNLSYAVSQQFTIFGSLTHNRNQMIEQMGQEKTDIRVGSSFTNEALEIVSEIDKKGGVNFQANYNILHNLTFLLNFKFSPSQKTVKKKVANFGIGFRFNTTPIEERLQDLARESQEKYLSEYNYENLARSKNKI